MKRSGYWVYGIHVGLLLIQATLLRDIGNAIGPTVDAPTHLAIGSMTLASGDVRYTYDYPPLQNYVNAIPVLLFHEPVLPYDSAAWQETARLGDIARAFLEANREEYLDILSTARWGSIFLSLLCAILLFQWARLRLGPLPALAAQTVLTFEPNMLAHGSLITNDLGATSTILLAAMAFDLFLHKPNARRFLGAGFALGLAALAKHTAILLIPPFWFAARCSKTLRRKLAWNGTESSQIGAEARCVGLLILLVFCAYGVIWAGYFFNTGSRGQEEAQTAYEVLPAPTHIQSFLSQRERMQKGQHSYFRGSMRYTGLLDYYPTLFVVKHTLPFHALLLIGLLVILRKGRHRDPRFQVMIWVPLVIAVALVTLNRVQIGYRHALPLVPFWCLWIGLAVRDGLLPGAHSVPRLLVRLRRNNRRGWRIAPRLAFAVGLILLAAHASSSLRTHPYELSYFNEPAGGPDAGVLWALDSNSDWGQALPDLERYVRENGIDRIRLWYFGPWEPVELYAIPAVPLDETNADEPGYVAISQTALWGRYRVVSLGALKRFRTTEPVAVLGHAINIYRQ